MNLIKLKHFLRFSFHHFAYGIAIVSISACGLYSSRPILPVEDLAVWAFNLDFSLWRFNFLMMMGIGILALGFGVISGFDALEDLDSRSEALSSAD